jgi:signal transduction histidine kinase
MLNKKKTYPYILKFVILTILFIAALYFESAQQQRLFVLIVVFLLFTANNIIKYFINKESKFYCILFIIDLLLIYFLELNSRLLINYFLHSFYIIVLLEASVTLEIKNGIIIGSTAVIVSMIKFAYLIYFKFNISSISQMIFFLIINILVLTVALFAQHNKQEREKKDILYKELLDAHKKLKEYTVEVKRLSIVEERNRIARDIHDNLGHNMTALIMQLQMAEHYIKTDSPKSQELLINSIKTAKDSLSGIREVVETLRETRAIPATDKAIKALAEEFSVKTGIETELNINGKIINNQQASEAIYHILQECLTNAVRHGYATKIWLELDYKNDSVTFNIKDNGTGAENLTEGYGMKGIRERVNDFNGSVEFKSENGFVIEGFILLPEN